MCACVRSEGLPRCISPLLFSSLHFMYCHSLNPKISWLLLKLAEHGRSSAKTVCELNEDCIAWIFITLCNIMHEVLKYILVSKISWEAHFDVHAPSVTIKLNWLHPSTCSSVWILSYKPSNRVENLYCDSTCCSALHAFLDKLTGVQADNV